MAYCLTERYTLRNVWHSLRFMWHTYKGNLTVIAKETTCPTYSCTLIRRQVALYWIPRNTLGTWVNFDLCCAETNWTPRYSDIQYKVWQECSHLVAGAQGNSDSMLFCKLITQSYAIKSASLHCYYSRVLTPFLLYNITIIVHKVSRLSLYKMKDMMQVCKVNIFN
jgi:hypothetical protein